MARPCTTKFAWIALVASMSIQNGRSAEPSKPAKAPSSQDSSARVDLIGDPLPPGARFRLGTLRFQHPHIVQDMALSPDGKTIVTIGGPLIAWDTTTGKKRWEAAANEIGYETDGPRYGDRAIVFAPHSRWFYMPSEQDQVRVWDADTGRQRILSISSANRVYRSIAVSPDGQKLALGGPTGVVVCDAQGTQLYEIENQPRGDVTKDRDDRLASFGHYSTASFSPDRKTLAIVTSDRPKVVRLFDAEKGRELRQIALADRLVRLAFSPDGKRIATSERESAVRLYSAETGQPIWSHIVALHKGTEKYTSAIAFSPDGKIVAAGATDHRIYFCDASAGDEVARLSGHHSYPWCLAFTADSKRLYSAGWDGTIRVWDVAARKQLPPPKGRHGSGVVAAAPNGETLAYVDDLGIVHLVNAKDGSERRTLEYPHIEYGQLAFSPDGGRLAAGGADPREAVQALIWDVRTGELLHRFHWPLGRDALSNVQALSFAPDGKMLAAAVFRQSTAYVFDLVNGICVARIKHRQIYGLSFSPNGRTLATAGWDSVIRIVDTQTWKALRQVKVDDGGVDARMYAVTYSPAGGWLATAHMDGRVRIWNAHDIKQLKRFDVRGGFAFGALAASPDGLCLAAGSSTGEVGLWDPSTGQQIWEAGKHRGRGYTVGFGRDSRTLVSGGADKVGYLWDLKPTGNIRIIDRPTP